MTLIVAGIEDGVGWLVADAAITGGPIELRTRQYEIKIYPIASYGLVAFAGDAHMGQEIANKLAGIADPDDLLRTAVNELENCPSVDLALMFQTKNVVRLYKVTQGGAESRIQLHLGDSEAFQHFQEIRHSGKLDHPPDAMIQFAAGSYRATNAPRSCTGAILTMISLFASRAEHDVGGWPLPYILGTDGLSLVAYGYSATDPMPVGLPLGTPIQFGTAAAGGFALSVTGAPEVEGIVVYWLQKPGGQVFVRERGGYRVHRFRGGPTEFRRDVHEGLGFEPSLWFDDKSTLEPKYVDVVSDSDGLERIAISSDGKRFSFTWLGNNTDGSFSVGHRPTMEDPFGESLVTSDDTRIELEQQSETQLTLTIADATTSASCKLDAVELDSLLRRLSSKRVQLCPAVSEEKMRGVSYPVANDPAWRTEFSPQTSAGALLWLRHPGSGWIGSILPPHEAKALGTWLVDYADKVVPAHDPDE